MACFPPTRGSLPADPWFPSRAAYRGNVGTLQVVWAAALLVTLAALPVGAVRMVAYRSGEVDHTRTMRIAMYVALAAGAAGLLALLVTSVLLLT